MLDLLHKAIDELPSLLGSPEGWESVDVTYHPPRVERLWRQWGKNRIFLHRIYPCHKEYALWHPHPWPSAVRVVTGRYEHRTGEAGGWRVKSVLVAGCEYEMRCDAWHSVRPLHGPSDSVMVTGQPFIPKVEMPLPPPKKQGPLSPERFNELFDTWSVRFRENQVTR